MANEGGYNESHLFWHRWLGIGVAVLSIIALGIKMNIIALPSGIFKIMLGTMIGLLMATGHFGGTMTHGATYLTEYLPFGRTEKALSLIHI